MILGIGIDLLNKERIEKIFYKFKNKIIDRFLSKKEKNIFSSLDNEIKKINFVAKRFSAKESFVKALGIGMGRGLERQNISILKDEFGKPYIELDYISKKFIGNFYNINIKNIKFDISMTDEKNLINTIVIISKC